MRTFRSRHRVGSVNAGQERFFAASIDLLAGRFHLTLLALASLPAARTMATRP
jgi:hypothetical protein